MTQTADELREELRRARNTDSIDIGSIIIDESGSNTEGISRSDVGSQQSIFTDLPGSSTEDDATDESRHDTDRSSNEKSIGVGSADRRSRKDSSGSVDRTETVRGNKGRAGRLEADDPIPLRIKEPKSRVTRTGTRSTSVEEKPATINEAKTKTNKPVQRGKETSKTGSIAFEGEGKEQKAKFSLPTFKEGTTLSITEAKALEGPLLSALESDFYYLDQYIWYRTQDPTQAPIWSDMDNEDLQVLTSILLKRGQKSPATAATVRAIVNGSTYVDVGMLMVPRFMKTVQVLKAAPKRQRPSLLERKKMAASM
jgi:hypothetical protein